MTVLARTIRAVPYRGASEAWDLITDLLASAPGAARDELIRVGGIAASVIASEVPKNDPVVVWGTGPRLRIYCLFGEEAILGDDANEQKLAESPTDGNWYMSLPCREEDLTWITTALFRTAVFWIVEQMRRRAFSLVEDSRCERCEPSSS